MRFQLQFNFFLKIGTLRGKGVDKNVPFYNLEDPPAPFWPLIPPVIRVVLQSESYKDIVILLLYVEL